VQVFGHHPDRQNGAIEVLEQAVRRIGYRLCPTFPLRVT
jgi:hypothetical protein